MTIFLFFMFLIIVAQRLLELQHAERNRRRAIERGAQEFGAEHYKYFVFLHTAWILGWVIEGWFTTHSDTFWADDSVATRVMTVAAIDFFLVAQALRYWAIFSLGEAWNTRILILPGTERVQKGPYKYVKHPNYIAVVIELAAVPLIFGAWKTALCATILNAILLLKIRIPAENSALEHLSSSSEQ